MAVLVSKFTGTDLMEMESVLPTTLSKGYQQNTETSKTVHIWTWVEEFSSFNYLWEGRSFFKYPLVFTGILKRINVCLIAELYFTPFNEKLQAIKVLRTKSEKEMRGTNAHSLKWALFFFNNIFPYCWSPLLIVVVKFIAYVYNKYTWLSVFLESLPIFFCAA